MHCNVRNIDYMNHRTLAKKHLLFLDSERLVQGGATPCNPCFNSWQMLTRHEILDILWLAERRHILLSLFQVLTDGDSPWHTWQIVTCRRRHILLPLVSSLDRRWRDMDRAIVRDTHRPLVPHWWPLVALLHTTLGTLLNTATALTLHKTAFYYCSLPQRPSIYPHTTEHIPSKYCTLTFTTANFRYYKNPPIILIKKK